MDGYGSKIRKVSRFRSTVSNETILATRNQVFFYKSSSLRSITDMILLGFWLILHPGMFISPYTTIYFFEKKIFFSNVYISVNTIFEYSYLYFCWEIDHPVSMYVTKGMERGHPNCVQVRTGGEGYHASCARTHLHYLFSCFRLVSCFICRSLTLPSLRNCVFVRNSYFSPVRSTSVVMK